MDINRSGFYKWLKRKNRPNAREINRRTAIQQFIEYHRMYPSHGYKWLNAKILLDTGVIYSDVFAHRCCKYAGIKSQAKHVKRYGKSKKEMHGFPNLMLKEITPTKPFEVVVSDMTAFYAKHQYYELTLYMDLFNNEIIAHKLSRRRGDPKTYLDGLESVLKKKEEYKDLNMVLHTDQGSVYSSKRFNEPLKEYNIIHSMSKPGCPTENGAMEAINGWIKEELFLDFNINKSGDIQDEIDNYIHYFNYERPSCVLNYKTPIQYKKINWG